jgi:hypothetical protein
MDYLTLLGIILGFSIFILNLETNILYNYNSFTITNIIKIMISPLHQNTFWHISQLKHNWIITTSICAIIGYTLSLCII